MRLYGYWRSSATWRVRIGLHLKGLSFEIVPVHLIEGQQQSAEHRARNPMAQVPVLELRHEGAEVRVTQSIAILELLDELHPEVPLLPADPYERARVRMLAEVVNSGIQPLQNLRIGHQLQALGADVTAWNRAVIADGLAALEALAAPHAERFLVGDQPTIAECCLIPQLYNARRNGVEVSAFPTLLRVEMACSSLPAFQAAHPDVQPDAPHT